MLVYRFSTLTSIICIYNQTYTHCFVHQIRSFNFLFHCTFLWIYTYLLYYFVLKTNRIPVQVLSQYVHNVVGGVRVSVGSTDFVWGIFVTLNLMCHGKKNHLESRKARGSGPCYFTFNDQFFFFTNNCFDFGNWGLDFE